MLPHCGRVTDYQAGVHLGKLLMEIGSSGRCVLYIIGTTWSLLVSAHWL